MARDRLLRKLLRERFQITLTTGETFDGLLDEWDGNHLVFIDAGVVTPIDEMRTKREPVAGQLFLRRDHIAYMQMVRP